MLWMARRLRIRHAISIIPAIRTALWKKWATLSGLWHYGILQKAMSLLSTTDTISSIIKIILATAVQRIVVDIFSISSIGNVYCLTQSHKPENEAPVEYNTCE